VCRLTLGVSLGQPLVKRVHVAAQAAHIQRRLSRGIYIAMYLESYSDWVHTPAGHALKCLLIGAVGMLVLSSSGCGGNTPTLEAIVVTPGPAASIPVGTSTQFSVTETYSDGSSKGGITSAVTWSSSAPSVATISSGGLATGAGSGSTMIRATAGSATGSANLTVVGPPSISVAPENPSIPMWTELQLHATENNPDGSTQDVTNSAIWSSTASGVATVNSTGAVNSLSMNVLTRAPGTATITATVGSMSGSTLVTVVQQIPGFVPTGRMAAARGYHTATLLNSGKVLVAGGSAQPAADPTSEAELYDPATGTFTATGNLNMARCQHTATLLKNGQVLIAGGFGAQQVAESTAELYDPTTGTFTLTGSLNAARSIHTATILNNGEVLIIGGEAANPSTTTAELYNPTSGTFAFTGSLNMSFGVSAAILLQSGRVLVVLIGVAPAGFFNSAAALYDVTAGTFAMTGNLVGAKPSIAGSGTLLNNGMVLVGGGLLPGTDAELYNPTTGAFTVTGSLNQGRGEHTATLLSDRTVLFVGGSLTHQRALFNAEVYDPATGSFAFTGSLNTVRRGHTATLLNDGRVLVTGGFASDLGPDQSWATAELYELVP
jgi:Bacterial Ig-like domain (group 2)/Galactose oxidase, central domain